jgi:hypothetical protein
MQGTKSEEEKAQEFLKEMHDLLHFVYTNKSFQELLKEQYLLMKEGKE